jgi:hypothetical protein
MGTPWLPLSFQHHMCETYPFLLVSVFRLDLIGVVAESIGVEAQRVDEHLSFRSCALHEKHRNPRKATTRKGKIPVRIVQGHKYKRNE